MTVEFKMMAILYRFPTQFFVLLVLILHNSVQGRLKESRHHLNRPKGLDIRKQLIAQENHYVQNVYFAACNCLTDEQYEREVKRLMRDDKCPKNVLEDAHRLTMKLGDKDPNLRIAQSLDKRQNPWTYAGRRAQGSLMYGTIWGLAGAAVWDMFGNTVKELCGRIPEVISIETVLEMAKKFAT